MRSLKEGIEFKNTEKSTSIDLNQYQNIKTIKSKIASRYCGIGGLAFNFTSIKDFELQKVFKEVDIMFLKDIEILPLRKEEINLKLMEWWQNNGDIWIQKLKNLMIQYRNIGHDWQFSEHEKQMLKQYCYANQLLIECVSQECYLSHKIRQEIEETLFLPIAEIEKRQGRRS